MPAASTHAFMHACLWGLTSPCTPFSARHARACGVVHAYTDAHDNALCRCAALPWPALSCPHALRQKASPSGIVTGPVSEAPVSEWGCFLAYSTGFSRPSQSLAYSPLLIKPGSFGGPTLDVDPSNPGNNTASPHSISASAVVRTGAAQFPFPGLACFNSQGVDPWLQIRLDPGFSRDVSDIVIYSGAGAVVAAAALTTAASMSLPVLACAGLLVGPSMLYFQVAEVGDVGMSSCLGLTSYLPLPSSAGWCWQPE